jgi:hypothetical protein
MSASPSKRTWLKVHSRRQLLANAAIAASRVASWPCVAQLISPLWSLAHIQGPILRRDRHVEDASDDDAVFEHVVIVVAPLSGRA